jgi:hypothetical protein
MRDTAARRLTGRKYRLPSHEQAVHSERSSYLFFLAREFAQVFLMGCNRGKAVATDLPLAGTPE